MKLPEYCKEKRQRIKERLETSDPYVAWLIVLFLAIGIIFVPQRMEAFFLLLAFAAAVYYAWQTSRQVEATQLLAGRATLFIMEPVKPHPSENGQWLIFSTKNFGQRAAVNVDASADWTREPADIADHVSPIRLRPCKREMVKDECELVKKLEALEGEAEEPYKVWRHWQLEPNEERFFGFPQPEEKKGAQGQPKYHQLVLRWYDPNFALWHSVVNVYWDDDDQCWSTNWDKAVPRRLR